MPLVILDRDGVINEDSSEYVKTVDEWRPIGGSITAIAMLQNKGFTVAIATNQSGIGRGYYTEATMHEMHDKMNQLIVAAGGRSIDYIAFCPHLPDEGCECRKPKPGLLDQIARAADQPLAGAILVGDSLRDLDAAKARKMQRVLVLTGNGVKSKQALGDDFSVSCFQNLKAYTESL